MSTYNTQLQSNNTDLQQVLQNLQSTSASIGNEVDTQADLISQIQSAVDNLPEAGSGGGNDTVSIAIKSIFSLEPPSCIIYYLDSNNIIQSSRYLEETISVMKNSIFAVIGCENGYSFTGLSPFYFLSDAYLVQATNDGTIRA